VLCPVRFDFVSLRDRIFAAVYDPLSVRAEKAFGAELKGALLADASGRTLEIGVGTGLSLAHYPAGVELTGSDPSEPMLRRARRRAADVGREIVLVEAPAETLPFEDDSFDTVVSLAVLCTVDDQQRALGEIHRVLRPDGRFLFLEHVRSPDPRRARTQDRWERPWGWISGGCHPNRRTLGAIEAAGFVVTDLEEREISHVPRLVRPHITGCAVPR
jgi:ubiquinone/menaquinone biosynthesis C-methylase UbiE